MFPLDEWLAGWEGKRGGERGNLHVASRHAWQAAFPWGGGACMLLERQGSATHAALVGEHLGSRRVLHARCGDVHSGQPLPACLSLASSFAPDQWLLGISGIR